MPRAHCRPIQQPFQIGALSALVLLSACAQVAEKEAPITVVDADRPPAITESSETVTAVETAIPDDSLLPLLQAEFALRARDYPLGLDLLSQQALVLTDPAVARRALSLAEFMENPQVAMAMAIRLADLDPSDGPAAAAASQWLARSNEPLLALEYAGKALALGSEVNIAANLANYQRWDEDTRQHITAEITDLAHEWPDNDQVAMAASLLARLQKRFVDAETLLEPVLQRSPEDVRALLLWTQLQMDQKQPDPLARLEQAVLAYPDNPSIRLQFARLLGAEREFARARQQFTVLLEQDPDNAELLMTAALLDYELNLFDPALALFQRLIDLDDRADEAYYYVGRIESARDRYEEAIAAFAAVGPSEQFTDAKVRAVSLLEETGFLNDIQAFFDAQRRRFPSAAEQLFLLEAESLKEWPGERMNTYDRGLIAFPNSFSLLYGRAMVYESVGAIDAMERDLRTILAEDPDHAATLNALGYSLTNRTQRYDEARALIERALALEPDDPAIMDSLGWVYFKLGQLPQSEALLRQAHQAFPDPEVAAHLGEVLWVMGREFEARDIWQDGLSRAPEHPIILEAMMRLGAQP